MELHNLKPAKGSVKSALRESLEEVRVLKKEVHQPEAIRVLSHVQDIQKK